MLPLLTRRAPLLRAPAVVAAEEAELIAQDLFTGADTTLIGAHTMDLGSGWTTAGDYQLSGNKLRHPSAGTTFQPCYTDVGTGDQDVRANVTGSFDSSGVWYLPHLLFRHQDASNYWMVEPVDGTLYLFERAAGSFVLRGSAAVATVTDTIYAMRVVASGTDISVYWDGVLKISHSSSALQSETECGTIIVKQGSPVSVATIDDFEVYSA
jgi:hypothetical protein